MDKYYIIRASRKNRERERRAGVRVFNKINAENHKRVQRRLSEVRILIEECKPSEEQCPNHEEHKAIKVLDMLICPHTYLVWRAWIAFEDGNLGEFIEQWEGDHDKLIRSYD